jgi:hypothetical protein
MNPAIPDFVSYQMLLESICTRPISAHTEEQLVYLVQLAEELCRLSREVLDNQR